MIIISSRQKLIESLNIALRAIPSRTTMNILYCVKINATADIITIAGNNMELGIETELEGSIEEKGMVCLDAKFLSEIIRKMPDSDILIKTDPEFRTTITSGSIVFCINGYDGMMFSPLPQLDMDVPVVINQFQLREIIRQTIFSTGINEDDIISTGEYCHVLENELTFIALDGHRIAIRKLSLNSSHEEIEAIIPRKSLLEIGRIMAGGSEDKVNIYFSKNLILFEIKHSVIVSRLINGKYYNVNQMMPDEFNTNILVNKAILCGALDRAVLFTNDLDKRPLILTIKQDTINLKIMSPRGNMSDDINVKMAGKELSIAFDPNYLLDALNAIDEEDITINFLDSRSPCFIKDDEQSYLYMVLPVSFAGIYP